jgi:hypothetical protein
MSTHQGDTYASSSRRQLHVAFYVPSVWKHGPLQHWQGHFKENKLLSENMHDVSERPKPRAGVVTLCRPPTCLLVDVPCNRYLSQALEMTMWCTPTLHQPCGRCSPAAPSIQPSITLLLSDAALYKHSPNQCHRCKKCKPLNDNESVMSMYNKIPVIVHPIENMNILGCMLSILTRPAVTD